MANGTYLLFVVGGVDVVVVVVAFFFPFEIILYSKQMNVLSWIVFFSFFFFLQLDATRT